MRSSRIRRNRHKHDSPRATRGGKTQVDGGILAVSRAQVPLQSALAARKCGTNRTCLDPALFETWLRNGSIATLDKTDQTVVIRHASWS